jgi:Surface-adhesin protein E
MKKKLGAALLLAAVSTSAVAEWVEIASNPTLTAYVDRTTIRKAGDSVRMWDLTDYKAVKVSVSGKNYLSSKIEAEYDCKAWQFRILTFSDHSGHMGAGEVVYRDPDPCRWQPVFPSTISEALWNIACGTVVAT